MPVDRYLFGNWEPDRPAHWLGEEGVRFPTNVVPFGRSWRRQPKVQPFRLNTGLPSGNTQGSEFWHEVIRVFNAKTFTGIDPGVDGLFFGGYHPVGGTVLYRVSKPLVGSGFIANVTRVAPYSFGPAWWDFCSYGSLVVATDGTNPVQSFGIGSTNFADLITSTDKPRALYCATIGSHLVLARMTSPFDALNPIKWWWSERDNGARFNTTGVARSGFAYLRPGGGTITGLVGGENAGVIFRERSAYIVERVSGGSYFNAQQIGAAGAGTVDPASVVPVGNDIYYWSQGGFARIVNYSQWEPLSGSIGLRGRPYMHMPEYALGDTAPGEWSGIQSKIYGAYDAHWNCVVWLFMDTAYPVAPDTRRLPFAMFIYSLDTGRWGHVNPQGLVESSGQEVIGLASWPIGQSAAQPLDGTVFITSDGGDGLVGSTINHFWFRGGTQARYLGGATYKICRVEGNFWHRNDQAIKIRRVRPIYSWASARNATAPSLVPTLEMEVRREPQLYRPNAAVDQATSPFVADLTIPLDPATSMNGWYTSGLPIEGQYFAFRFSVPAAGAYNEITAVEDPQMTDIVGVEIDWVPSGQKG